MRTLCFIGLASLAVPAFGADWNPQLAAKYLDSRQKQWFEWTAAKATGGPCISCHTGVTYLFARPELRKLLGENEPTTYEVDLRKALRARVRSNDTADMYPAFAKSPTAAPQGLGVETVLAALFLAPGEKSATLDADAEQAFDRLWSHQIQDGPNKGAWQWFSLKLDPYEMPQSVFYGATFAAMAIGSTPTSYRKQPKVKERIANLTDYFAREWESQPLHNRLMLLWASNKLPAALPRGARKPLIEEVFRRQNQDGGWDMQALGPWTEHPAAPPSAGGNSYATALVTFVLSSSGVSNTTAGMERAVKWLESHQDLKTGYWAADSMNKKYEQGSIPEGFMRDAATAFASMALTQAAQ